MKTKLLIFLLAIGGNMSAQLVLPICSVNLPCPGFPLGSVQAPIDQNGWRNFKVTLTSNVTSFSFVGIPPTPAQASVNVIFTQDVVGGRTVTFAAGISSSCTITTAANSTTLCQFEYDGTAATWFSISGGGGGGSWEAGTGVSTTGVFTSAQQNDFLLSTLTGGATCPVNTIVNLGGSTFKLTDGIGSCVNIPTSGVTNAFTNGFGSYLINPNANGTGQNNWVGAVGYYSQVWCRGGSASNTHCWGANFSTSDDTALPATLFGNEYDITVNNNTTSGAGTLYSYLGNGQPTGDTFPAITLKTSGSGAFTAGFECQTASLAGTSPNIFACLNIGQQSGGLSQNSQFAFWNASNASGAIVGNLGLHQDGPMLMGGASTWMVNVPSGSENFAIALTATPAIGVNTLVKIDTANPDAVVACTTTDTVCHGFTQGSANTHGLCLAGSASCPVVAGSGQKVKGVLGTGTCAIGNNVIVDTTSNGRIKCTASQPAQGAWIGIAISSQNTVGNTVDILTKFQ